MAKYVEKNYTFNVATRTITFLDYITIDIRDILLILNLKLNKEIYNIADAARTGTVVGNVLTLDGPLTGMSNTDDLQIWLYVSQFNSKAEVDSGDSSITYLGKAIVGVADSDPYWQISRITETATGSTSEIADGNDNFDNVWNNRELLSYS